MTVEVRVFAIRLTIVACVNNGWPRQFRLMNENKRCSILFHLLVPGGRWQTWIVNPVSQASLCSSHFHKRTRAPFDRNFPSNCTPTKNLCGSLFG